MENAVVVASGVASLPSLHIFPSFLSSDYLFKLLLIGDSGVGKSCPLLTVCCE